MLPMTSAADQSLLMSAASLHAAQNLLGPSSLCASVCVVARRRAAANGNIKEPVDDTHSRRPASVKISWKCRPDYSSADILAIKTEEAEVAGLS